MDIDTITTPGSIIQTGTPEDDRHWMYLLCRMWAFNLGVRGGGYTHWASAANWDIVVAATTATDVTVVSNESPESAATAPDSSG